MAEAAKPGLSVEECVRRLKRYHYAFKRLHQILTARITAEPKTDNLPYSAVEFVVTAQNRIREVKVTEFDHSTLDFTFEEESLNPALDGKLFQFRAPPGAEVVEGGV